MSTTDTPETDVEAYDCTNSSDEISQQRDMCKWGSHVSSDFARKLERERDKAREDAKRLAALLDEPMRISGCDWPPLGWSGAARLAIDSHNAITTITTKTTQQ